MRGSTIEQLRIPAPQKSVNGPTNLPDSAACDAVLLSGIRWRLDHGIAFGMELLVITFFLAPRVDQRDAATTMVLLSTVYNIMFGNTCILYYINELYEAEDIIVSHYIANRAELIVGLLLHH